MLHMQMQGACADYASRTAEEEPPPPHAHYVIALGLPIVSSKTKYDGEVRTSHIPAGVMYAMTCVYAQPLNHASMVHTLAHVEAWHGTSRHYQHNLPVRPTYMHAQSPHIHVQQEEDDMRVHIQREDHFTELQELPLMRVFLPSLLQQLVHERGNYSYQVAACYATA
jgi:hypothetical protein